MTLTTTFALLREHEACAPRYRHLAKALGGIRKYGQDASIPLLRILETNGITDTLWALQATKEDAQAVAIEVDHHCRARWPSEYFQKIRDCDATWYAWICAANAFHSALRLGPASGCAELAAQEADLRELLS